MVSGRGPGDLVSGRGTGDLDSRAIQVMRVMGISSGGVISLNDRLAMMSDTDDQRLARIPMVKLKAPELRLYIRTLVSSEIYP